MEQIIYWNLPDGYAHGAAPGDYSVGENRFYSGLFRFDMTPKPAYQVLKKLIHEEWHTQTELVSDCGGNASFKGFHGNYEITLQYDGKEVKKQIHLADKLMNEVEICL